MAFQGPGPSRLRTWLAWVAQRNSGSCPSMWTAGWTAVLATFPEHAPRKTWNVSWMTQSPSKVMHSCGRAVRRGRGCLQGRGLWFGTNSPVCRRGSLGCAHSQERLCCTHHRVAVPWTYSCVPALAGSQQTPALWTWLMPCFFCFLPRALSWYLSLSHMDKWHDPAHTCP